VKRRCEEEGEESVPRRAAVVGTCMHAAELWEARGRWGSRL